MTKLMTKLRQSYDNHVINLMIFRKSGPWFMRLYTFIFKQLDSVLKNAIHKYV